MCKSRNFPSVVIGSNYYYRASPTDALLAVNCRVASHPIVLLLLLIVTVAKLTELSKRLTFVIVAVIVSSSAPTFAASAY
jgi:hypothetical protein